MTDFAAGLVTLAGDSDDQVWLNVCWMVSYVLWGAAALHPSMARLGEPDAGARVRPAHPHAPRAADRARR